MAEQNADSWDHTVDVLIVGSGAGAMVTALSVYEHGGQPLLIEKSSQYGGSSAMSGGGLWIPNNHLMPSVGISDSPEEALEYMRATTRGLVPEERLQAYVEEAPKMARFLTDRTRVELVALAEYPDYYQDAPGSKPGGRSLEAPTFDARLLGDEFLRMRECAVQELIAGRICMTIKEARDLFCKGPGWMTLTMKLMARYWLDLPWRFKSRRDRNLGMGNALVGRLRRSLMDRDIPLWLSTPAKELVVENGRVTGVVAERQGRTIRICARRGVVLAAGGFESNQAMREKYLPNPTRAEWTCANPYNTGDAIEMGLRLGAAVDLMDDAWWGPTTVVPGEDRARMLVIEKSLPGSILVNKRGERFVDEAMPYIDVVNKMYEMHSPESPCVPAYLIFDANFRRKYPCGPMMVPGSQQPDWALPKIIRQQYLKKANTIREAAGLFGIDPDGLEATVAKFNEYARTGKDLDFGRGESIFDRYYGDENVKPNPTLAPIEKPPFYVIEAFPGELGTKGGLVTDARAHVLKEDGSAIPGLYAIGNCSASVMGRTYPGPGATLGPACTFGFIAGRDAMGA
ncbi:MAG: FAD-binding protein [Deltaproteobacteria bacterium]|nr:MAG: FAD-binding protein [Deltaproteobacteria bacterium]